MTDPALIDILTILRLAVKELQEQINVIEADLEALRERFTSHSHPWQPAPRYK